MTLAPSLAVAHPHVFVEANLEILRNAQGAVTELRHVWRFDELFSSMVLLDYDENGDGKLDSDELDAVSQTVTQSLSEYNFYTEVRLGREPQAFQGPERIMVDYTDGQVLMFFAATMKEPLEIAGKPFRVAVSDPTYYVAIEIADESAVQITGNGTACKAAIERPDFDQLYAQNSQTLTEQFFNDPANASLGDDWLTWVNFQCD
ncbi:MAG: ABC transporter substrate-binding protein [Alphaproteobacteria bacterium]|nr:MAG: ABC transporter substrate-binding protein [Alphaproteobacteria bacterium]